MRELIQIYLPWLLSGLSMAHFILVGNLWRWSWVFGLCCQVLWLTWIICTGPKALGFLPLTLALFVIYTRNHFKWAKNRG